MSDLIQELNAKNTLLSKAITELKNRGQDLAQAERDYRVALQKEIIRLRTDNTSVTLTSDLARGNEEVAGLKYQRDLADVLYKSASEAINVYKLQVRLLEEQIKREWGNCK